MKDSLVLFILILGVFWLFRIYVSKQKEERSSVLEVNDFKKALKQENSPQLIDVRTLEEHQKGHILGSKLIDVLEPNFEKSFGAYDKKKPIFIYCRSGKRSLRAAKILQKQGFKKIIDLKGGYMAWEQANQTASK